MKELFSSKVEDLRNIDDELFRNFALKLNWKYFLNISFIEDNENI